MNRGRAENRGRRRMLGARGSSAVEAAIVTPVVMAMFFGTVELGFLFKDYLAVAGAVRSGVRMASANPRLSTFAQVAADSVARTGGAANLRDVQQMWVYKADTATDAPIGFTGFSDCTVCVKFRYDAGTRAFIPISDNWAANSQNACSSSSIGGPPDRIGIYLQLKHDAFTKFVFNSVTISEDSVLTFEPMPVVTGCK